MNRWQQIYLKAFFVFSAILFLSFQAYHFYLIYQTEKYVSGFEKRQTQLAFQEFSSRLMQHSLFDKLLNRKLTSRLAEQYFLQELSRIEKNLYLDGILILDETGKTILLTPETRQFLEEFDINPDIPDLSRFNSVKSHRIEHTSASVAILFSMRFPELFQLQKNYLRGGFLLFLIIFVMINLISSRHFKKVFELQKTFEAQKRMAEFGQMAAGVAHDVRNPLGIINLRTQELKEMHEGDPETEELLFSIKKEVKRINHTVGTLMVFERENLNLTEKVQLPEMIEDILSGEEFTQLKATLKITPVTITGNRDLLHRMFNNLLLNSLEAAKESGNSPEVYLNSKIEDHNLYLFIEDNGPGIQEPDRILEPFYTTKNYGTGLGLSVVQDAVARHEGTLTFKNRENLSGAMVTIILPYESNTIIS